MALNILKMVIGNKLLKSTQLVCLIFYLTLVTHGQATTVSPEDESEDVPLTCYNKEDCLYQSLFVHRAYKSQVRPVISTTDTINVNITVELKSILGLEEKNEVLITLLTIKAAWTDHFLRYNGSVYPVDFFLVQASTIWTPDFTITNNVYKFFEETYTDDFRAYVTPYGMVLWKFGGIFKTSCSIHLTHYPFDKQECSIVIENWSNIESFVNLTDAILDVSDYSENSLWEMTGYSTKRETTVAAEGEGLAYPKLTFTIKLTRLWGYYIVNMILPCILVTFAAFGVFWLPPESGEKLSLGITVLLAYSVFQIVIMDSTPVNSRETPFISKLILSVMSLTTMSVIVALITIYISFKKPTSRMSPWLRMITFKWIAKIICIKDDLPDFEEDFDLVEQNGKQVDSVSMNKVANVQKDTKMKPNSPLINEIDKFDSLIKELKIITSYIQSKEKDDLIVEEWKCLAKIIDRCCFWICTLIFTFILLPIIIAGE